MANILAADIGGTNSRFAAFETDARGHLALKEKTQFKTWDYKSFPELLNSLRQSGFGLKPEDAKVFVLAVPGPVKGLVCTEMANTPWGVDLDDPRTGLSSKRLALINDFVAQGYACRTEAVADAGLVKPGTPAENAPLGVIGAGTGLGHCVLVPTLGGSFIAVAAEAGHTAFPFIGEEEFEFFRFLVRETKFSYPENETVVSGGGLSLVHRFLTGEDLTPAEVSAKLTPESRTCQWFSRFYARACRHYCLNVLPRGGLFIAGGVAAKNPMLVDNDAFRSEFEYSETYAELLRNIPIRLVTNEDSGLWGAAFRGLLELGRT